MALITNDIQARLAKLLSEEGLVRAEVISQSVENAKAANQSLIAYFLENKIVDNDRHNSRNFQFLFINNKAF